MGAVLAESEGGVRLLALVILVALALVGCASNVDYVKERGAARWREVGYEPIGYEGYQWGLWFGPGYGGASVWWSLRRVPDNGTIYTGYLRRWGDELHVYGPHAIDAIRGGAK